jgi:hypothetical protein
VDTAFETGSALRRQRAQRLVAKHRPKWLTAQGIPNPSQECGEGLKH